MEPPRPPNAGDGAPQKVVGGGDGGGSGGASSPPLVKSNEPLSLAEIDTVVVHPLVLLSVTDHYYRVYKDFGAAGSKRVVGVLLGESFKGRVDVTNSFAVPFEEDPRNPKVFFFDHDYLETMAAMFKKVRGRGRRRVRAAPPPRPLQLS